MPTSSSPGRFRAVPVSWSALALVAAGGALGTALREALSLIRPPIDGVPVTTAAINVVGAFALGWLLAALTAAGPDTGRRRAWRTFAGAGVLGGFTTYSALAADTVLLAGPRPLLGLGYAVGTVALGWLAAAAGLAVGRRTGNRR